MLKIRDVTRRFGKNTAVDSVAIDIPDGQMVGIIGRSGAGKSTLLRMINRLVDPSEGSIFFEDTEVSSLSRRSAADVAARLRDDLPAVQPRAAARRGLERAARHAEPPLDAGYDVQPLSHSADIHQAIDILDRLGIADMRPSASRRCRAASSSAWRSPAR